MAEKIILPPGDHQQFYRALDTLGPKNTPLKIGCSENKKIISVILIIVSVLLVSSNDKFLKLLLHVTKTVEVESRV